MQDTIFSPDLLKDLKEPQSALFHDFRWLQAVLPKYLENEQDTNIFHLSPLSATNNGLPKDAYEALLERYNFNLSLIHI